MKRHLIYIFLLVCTLTALGQTASAQTASQNFVLSRHYKQAGAGASDIGKVNIQVQYIDGLGRPVQTVSVGQSAEGTDIVQPIAYDALGRQPKAYLPYASGSHGSYKDNALKVVAPATKTDQERF
ncbi:DUF6443 domain-containing protein, partial [Dyadobacter sp. LHD-138]|uniref:DUF6443 domain-containing protein n=1 Tax=Dyadobacter sp. LHD-138 TaxID=3071413 RepID=UPI0027DFC42C